MPKVLKRTSAKRDFVDIFVYLEEHAGIRVANRFLLAADQTIKTLATLPLSGMSQLTTNSELAGMRRKRIKGFPNHLIFYFPINDGIDVIRVIHAARDLGRLFDEEFS